MAVEYAARVFDRLPDALRGSYMNMIRAVSEDHLRRHAVWMADNIEILADYVCSHPADAHAHDKLWEAVHLAEFSITRVVCGQDVLSEPRCRQALLSVCELRFPSIQRLLSTQQHKSPELPRLLVTQQRLVGILAMHGAAAAASRKGALLPYFVNVLQDTAPYLHAWARLYRPVDDSAAHEAAAEMRDHVDLGIVTAVMGILDCLCTGKAYSQQLTVMGKGTLDLGADLQPGIQLCTCSGVPSQTCSAPEHADVLEGFHIDKHARQGFLDHKGLQLLENNFRGLASWCIKSNWSLPPDIRVTEFEQLLFAARLVATQPLTTGQCLEGTASWTVSLTKLIMSGEQVFL